MAVARQSFFILTVGTKKNPNEYRAGPHWNPVKTRERVTGLARFWCTGSQKWPDLIQHNPYPKSTHPFPYRAGLTWLNRIEYVVNELSRPV